MTDRRLRSASPDILGRDPPSWEPRVPRMPTGVVYTAFRRVFRPVQKGLSCVFCSALGSCTRLRKEPVIGKQRTTFNKQARERASKAKASAKRERRQDRSEKDETEDETPRESAP